jgi:hypothetical protein
MFARILASTLGAVPLALAALAAPAAAIIPLNASWMVTYYIDPSGSSGGTQCINFRKKSDAGGVVTGTWDSPTFPGWSGEWVQKGQHYSWYGKYANAQGVNVATYDAGDFITATITAEPSIGAFMPDGTKPVSVYTGTATMLQVASCNGMSVRRGATPAN